MKIADFRPEMSRRQVEVRSKSGRPGFPVKRQQLSEVVNAMRIDAGQHITQIREGLDAAQFGGLDQRQDRSGGLTAAH